MSGPRRSKRKSSAKKPFVKDCPTVSAPDTFEEQSCKVSGVAASSKAPRRSTRKSRSKIAVKPKENSITIQHGLNEELYDMFLENVDDNLEEDDDLIPASGASVEAAHIGSFPPAAANILSPASYTCEICHSVLKTKHGFSKHVIAHRIKEMRKPCLEEGNNLTQTYSISDNQEEIAFNLHLRKLLQKYYIKGLRYGTKLWLARCASIRQRFVQGLEFDSSPSVDSLISNDTWEEDKNGIVHLKLDPTIVKFFLFVESTIERLIIDDQSVNSDTVLQVLFRDAPEMLDLWHSLTSHFLSELESLTFMKDIISLICNL